MNGLMCSKCGKEMKSRSGLTLHEKKCEGTGTTAKGEIKILTNGIPIDSVVVVTGDVWTQDKDYNWKSVPVSGVPMRVVGKEINDAKEVMLMCRINNLENSSLYSISESEAMNRGFKVMEPMNDEEDSVSEPDPEIQPDPGIIPVEEKAKFRKSLDIYVSARDGKLHAEKVYKKSDSEHRPVLVKYLEAYGERNAKGNVFVEDMGYKVENVLCPGKESIQYDNKAMVEWLLENNHDDCLRQTVEIAMWNNLKLSGKIPPEVIAACEKPVMGEDKWSFTVKASSDK